MAEKSMAVTPELAAILKRRGLNPEHYVMLFAYPNSFLVRDTITREARVIYKEDLWKRVLQ